MDQSGPIPPKRWPSLAIALLLSSSTLVVDASHSSWRRPSLLKRPFNNNNQPVPTSYELRRHRRRSSGSSSSTTSNIDNIAASLDCRDSLFGVRGGGEGNGPCIGIDLGMFSTLLGILRSDPSMLSAIGLFSHQNTTE
mmetsp:Transcript_18518/g.34317  ORF Transcript_18518/g.34317 Transcript_18518/m.34317 type:complete len:138 (+) Transcript_18518:106-519(+)